MPLPIGYILEYKIRLVCCVLHVTQARVSCCKQRPNGGQLGIVWDISYLISQAETHSCFCIYSVHVPIEDAIS